jgi:hypothetical protein
VAAQPRDYIGKIMNDKIPKISVTQQVQEAGNRFAKLVVEYCKVVEGHTEIPVIEFMIRLERLLSRIYLEASELPIVDLPSELIDSNSKPSNPSDALKFHARMKQLASYLGKYNRYWHVVDPLYDADHESTEYSIAGDLSEIYDDLLKHLDSWQNGNPTQKNEAISEWQLHWKIHWGDHVLSALRAIHEYIDDYIYDTDGDEMELRNKYLN